MISQKLSLLPTASNVDALYVFPSTNEGKTYKVSLDLLSSWILSKTEISTNANYTIVSNDKQSIITFNSSSSTTLLLPKNSDQPIPIGITINVHNNSTSSVNIVGDTGVSVNSAIGFYIKNYGMASLTKINTNSWILSGDLSLS